MTDDYGELRADGEVRSVRYERYFDATPEEVWAALTKPERLAQWLLADARLDPEVGGTVRLSWEGSGEADGVVKVFDPPSVLEYSWTESSTTSVVRFELRPMDAGVVLTLHHRELPPRAIAGVGAGWHAHLDSLRALLASEPIDFWPRFHELEPEYEKRAAEL